MKEEIEEQDKEIEKLEQKLDKLKKKLPPCTSPRKNTKSYTPSNGC